mgnify:CR=1 FL=1
MSPDLLYLACAIIAVIISGLAKGGFAGVGALAMPIMALGVDPVRGAAILLPILILQDAVSVWAYRRQWDGRNVAILSAGAVFGDAPVVNLQASGGTFSDNPIFQERLRQEEAEI